MKLPTETQVEALVLLCCAAIFAALAAKPTPGLNIGPWPLATWCAGFFAVCLFAAITLLATE